MTVNQQSNAEGHTNFTQSSSCFWAVIHIKQRQHCQKRRAKTVSITNTLIAKFGQTLFMSKSCSRWFSAFFSSICSFSFSQAIVLSAVELVEASWLEARTATACDPIRDAALFMTLLLRSASMVVTRVLLWLIASATLHVCSRWQGSQGLSDEFTVCRDLCSCANKQSAGRADLIGLAVEGRTDTLAQRIPVVRIGPVLLSKRYALPCGRPPCRRAAWKRWQ